MTTQTLPSGWTIQHEGRLIRKDLKRRDEWITALRSGKYEQGCGLLRSSDDKYCCLGVLLQLEGKEFHAREGLSGYYVNGGLGSHSTTTSSYVGEDVDTIEFAGVLPITVTLIKPNDITMISAATELAVLNDCGVPFDVIADVIEYCFNQK